QLLFDTHEVTRRRQERQQGYVEALQQQLVELAAENELLAHEIGALRLLIEKDRQEEQDGRTDS
ncbi:MAG: hypothetical protein ACRDIB_03760, partial [Ardenticatenaceae bacterium]